MSAKRAHKIFVSAKRALLFLRALARAPLTLLKMSASMSAAHKNDERSHALLIALVHYWFLRAASLSLTKIFRALSALSKMYLNLFISEIFDKGGKTLNEGIFLAQNSNFFSWFCINQCAYQKMSGVVLILRSPLTSQSNERRSLMLCKYKKHCFLLTDHTFSI